MTIELDHFFILTAAAAPHATSLSALGLVEGTSNSHAGQGTANRRFFFEDAMLELLYLRDPAEARKQPAARLRLVERLSTESASPFGLVLRREEGCTSEPFRGWNYRPEYLDAGQPLLIGENSERLEEPLCLAMPHAAGQSLRGRRSVDPFRRVSELRISVPISQPSAALLACATADRITLCLERPHLMEIIFQSGGQGEQADLRPGLPLVLRW